MRWAPSNHEAPTLPTAQHTLKHEESIPKVAAPLGPPSISALILLLLLLFLLTIVLSGYVSVTLSPTYHCTVFCIPDLAYPHFLLTTHSLFLWLQCKTTQLNRQLRSVQGFFPLKGIFSLSQLCQCLLPVGTISLEECGL